MNDFIASLRQKLPDADVHGIRQFTEAEAKIYNRISGLLTATVAVVLILTALCVMAAMTNVAMERKNDVGLMKAIGGATRRVPPPLPRRSRRCSASSAAHWAQPRAFCSRSLSAKPSSALRRSPA